MRPPPRAAYQERKTGEARYWKIPRLWHDPAALCYVVGGGPSLIGVDLSCLAGYHAIAVNCAIGDVPTADFCFFGDYRWGIDYRDMLKAFAGQIVTCNRDFLCNERGILVTHKLKTGISHSQDAIAWNANSGAAAINLAYLLGAKRIVLLGFDMKSRDGKTHFHHHYDTKPKAIDLDADYRSYAREFRQMATELERYGVRVYNGCPDSYLTCFQRYELSDVLPPALDSPPS